jgi:hypothetical protein
MRLDLPSAPTHAVTNKVASLCISSFSRIRHCEAVALIAYTDLGHREAMKRFSPFLHRLEKAFMQQGFGIRNSFIQSASGWAEIDDNEAPATGWPLSSLDEERPAEADTSPVSHRELQLRDLDLPARDPGTAEQVEDALELLLMGHERNAFGVVIPAEELDQVDLIERLLSEEPENLKPATMARICSVAMIPALRDPMMVQMAFGAEVGRRALHENEIYHERAERAGMSIDELAERDMAEGRASDPCVDMIIGDWPDPPDVDRLQAARLAVAHVAAHSPDWGRAPMLCLLGWLCWAGGGGSAAGTHLENALRLDPDLRMARLLLMLISSGKLPDWGFNAVDRIVTATPRSVASGQQTPPTDVPRADAA